MNNDNKNNYRSYLENKYKSLFEDRIGCMTDVKVSIETDPAIKPTQQAPYTLPHHMIPGTRAKLNDMIRDGIIEAVPECTHVEWVAPMLPVLKKAKGVAAKMKAQIDKSRIRIKTDNKRLNKAIIRSKRPMPSVSQLQYDLNGNKWFSIVDIKDAFSTVRLDEASRNLTIFAIPWGLFRYMRLNMGLPRQSLNTMLLLKLSLLS